MTELIEEAGALLKDPAVKGFKFHPPDQNFYPDDRSHYELWELLDAGQKPVMFHTGFTVLGANQDGGKGIGLDCGRPIHLDTLARDFPRMKIIAAHPGWPWQEELIGVVTHKKNIYVDTSGYLAEQLPELFQRAIRGRLQDKALFGTDFPYVDLEKALVSFDKLGLKDPVKEKILLSNARADSPPRHAPQPGGARPRTARTGPRPRPPSDRRAGLVLSPTPTLPAPAPTGCMSPPVTLAGPCPWS